MHALCIGMLIASCSPPCIKENQYALGAASTNGDSPSIGFCIESLICGKYEGANQGSAESYWKWELRYL